ncbi:ABC transporter ATP-binding protein [Herpetosiphon sp. NSE202]|uniref:ABC transporter ATP-binding protein n=1 Tax=Herpetosiphon sp. NSE202 TaxID=3351349 RepID=UPI00364535BE
MSVFPPAALQTQNLVLGYQRTTIIDQLNAEIPHGQVTAIIGPNGCGKSTLLAGLAKLHPAKQGQILLDGRDIARLSPREMAQSLALLPQDGFAPDGMTVADLVRFGRHPHTGLLRQWSKDDQQAVVEAIATADLSSMADRPLTTLSGGQRQRAWIAMALAQATPLLLLDEPTAALDLGHQIEVFELIRQLAAEGKTVVMVVHDLASACRYADHLIAMRTGKIIAAGAPKTIVTPELIHQLYGVHCRLIPDPVSGTPIIVGVQRSIEKLEG